jgi:hypothetical protein
MKLLTFYKTCHNKQTIYTSFQCDRYIDVSYQKIKLSNYYLRGKILIIIFSTLQAD